MFRLFFTTLLSLFLLFQTTSFAEEEYTDPQEAAIEEEMPPSNIDPEDSADIPQEEAQEKAQESMLETEEISEAEKEAIEAEQAEIQEAGIEEEAVLE